jgi:hypothetical protein
MTPTLTLRDQPYAAVPCLRALVGYTLNEPFNGVTHYQGVQMPFAGRADVFTVVGYGPTPLDAKRMARDRGHKGGVL